MPMVCGVRLRLEDKPDQGEIPVNREKVPRLLHRIHEDILLQPVNDQGDSVVMWIDSPEYSEQRSLTRN